MVKFIIIGLFVLSEIMLLSQNKEDSLLYWKDEKPLMWGDFKGGSDVGSCLFAVSSIEIKTSGIWKDDLPLFKVVCYFDKNKSWTTDTLSELLLKHEQLHFDISETFSRKLRKGLIDLRKNGETRLESYYGVIKKLLEANNIRQDQYDLETSHGIITEKQEKWNKKVKKELAELEEYAIDYSKYLEQIE